MRRRVRAQGEGEGGAAPWSPGLELTLPQQQPFDTDCCCVRTSKHGVQPDHILAAPVPAHGAAAARLT